MNAKLAAQAVSKFLIGVALVGLLVFLPAGSLEFSNGCLFMAILFLPMLVVGFVLMVKNPELLAKRLESKEKQATQQTVVKLSGLMFLVGFVLAGMDYRFGWSDLSGTVVTVASVVFLAGYIMYAEVLRENTYLSRTIQVTDDQQVIDTGLYGIVRHPMYLATLLMFMTMPLVLGSLPSFVVFCTYPFLMAARIKDEEKVLTAKLPGYAEYKEKVRYKMIPFVW
ncbi:MAG: isoprenylcysteine carboxylmethyltransferase family protein [Firmicutes bacterium]|nr:isoprenylcysteine carboxylmethyltransferase family protein [Bacillota bacterium]